MVGVQEFVTVLKGCVKRKEMIDVSLSCGWCDMAKTFQITDAYVDEEGELRIEGENGLCSIKHISDAEISVDDFGTEFHVEKPMVGLDWMISLV